MASYVAECLSGKVTSHAWFSASLCLMSLPNFIRTHFHDLCLLGSLGKHAGDRECHDPQHMRVVYHPGPKSQLDGHERSKARDIFHPDPNGYFMQGFHKKQKKTLSYDISQSPPTAQVTDTRLSDQLGSFQYRL